MPSDRSYGNILRSERERSGYDLTSMSRRLHIRPDILQAIEVGDFDRMPARGYTKNMVRAYARALKLDEQHITNMFLDEMNMHESGVARRSPAGPHSSYGAGQGHSRRQPSRRYEDGEEPYRGRQPRSAGRISSRNGRELIDPNPARPRKTRSRDSQEAPGRSRSRQSQNANQGGIGEKVAMGVGALVGSFTQGRGRQETRVPRNFNTIGSTPPYARTGSAVGNSSGFGSMNLPMVLAVVAAVIVLLIVVVVISNGSKQAAEDVPDIPISGLTDTSSPDDAIDATTVDSVPEFAVFTYAVEDGKKAWLEIYENEEEDPVFSEVVEGPKEETYEVRDTLTIRTAAPDYVTLTLDGEEVEFEKVSGSQYYAFTVDFADILNQWNIDHGRATSSSKSSSSKTSSSSSSKSASSSSSSSSSSKSSSSSSSRSSQSR